MGVLDEDSGYIDGRNYQFTIASQIIDQTDGSLFEYLDWAHCEEDGTDQSVWACQIYFPAVEEQTEGYAAFQAPGVITGYYVSSYLPNLPDLSYAKTTGVIYQGATSVTTYCSAVLAAIYALTF